MTAIVPEDTTPPEATDEYGEVAAPRVARHVLRLDNGHRVQVAVAGRGVPLVVVHGYTAEGFLYAQTLSRLVASGFKVVAIDTAGHGGTEGLRRGGANLRDYAGFLGRVLDHLGIPQAVFVGHSMGGRIVTELVARTPRRGMAVILVDAIVGDTWDGMVQLYRMAPPLMTLTGATLFLDTMTTMPVLRDRRQAVKLAKLWVPVWAHNVRRPWKVAEAGISILRSAPTRWMLERMAEVGMPVFVVHGDRDIAVPLKTARDAAKRANGELVVVHGATHAWPLKDPETLPGIVSDLLAGRLGVAVRDVLATAGLNPGTASIDDIERVLYAEDACVLELTPPPGFVPTGVRRAPPRYRWTRTGPDVDPDRDLFVDIGADGGGELDAG